MAVVLNVFALRCDFQIVRVVVGLIPVHVVHHLIVTQKPSQFLLHYQSVLIHVTLSAGCRMVWSEQANAVSVLRHPTPPVTIRVAKVRSGYWFFFVDIPMPF